jgi:hypothetical protein
MTALYIYSVRLSKNDGRSLTSSGVSGYRLAESEDEARGAAVATAFKYKPEFGIDEITILVVSPEHVMQAYDAIFSKEKHP